ncbi:MAG: NUDIX hydrolase [Alphaproteobacteria bacterium]
MPLYDHPENFRAYGILLRQGRVLISAEYVADVFCWKFPGGGVGDDESAEQALAREFREETGLDIAIGALLHAPGTLFSPWSRVNYTPVYYRVTADGAPVVPDHEPVEMRFKEPQEALASGLMAEPETVALRRALERIG